MNIIIIIIIIIIITLLSACAEHSGDWLHASPITAVGMRLNDEMVRISIATRLEARACELHTCPCGKEVDARGLHGLSCRKSAAGHIRHAHLNDIIWRSVKRAQIPAVKEPVGLSRDDGKRPDGATLIPWARGKALAWDVTVADTFALSHVGDTSILAGSAAKSCGVAQNLVILQHSRHKHFCPCCHRNWRRLRHTGQRIHPKIGKKNHCMHQGSQRNTIYI